MRALFIAIGLVTTLANAEEWKPRTDRSDLHIHVRKRGLLSAAAHDHLFRARRFEVRIEGRTADPLTLRLRVSVDSSSLKDEAPGLSPKDRASVEQTTAGPEVLDHANHPEVVLEGSATEARPTHDGATVTLLTRLTLHGTTRELRFPVELRFRGDEVEAQGSFRIRQSDYGIRPYTAMLGTVGVEDEVEIRFRLVAVPSADQDSRSR